MASTSTLDDVLPSTSNTDDSAPSTSSTDISKEILNEYDGNFLKIFGTRDYVDKTNFIQEVLMAGTKTSIITAPSKFGKTNNLLMLKDFFDIRAKNNNREHYEKLNIFKNENISDLNFRNTPVLYVDLAAEGELQDLTVSSLIRVWKIAIRKAFVEQYPALKGRKLRKTDHERCRYWCENSIDDIVLDDDDEMFLDLNLLVYIMFAAYQLPVILLIDNYDYAINMTLQNAAFSITDFKHIQSFTNIYLEILLNSDKLSGLYIKNIRKIVITGVSSLMILPEFERDDELNIYRFLDDHPFGKYFGITELELDTLLNMEENKELLIKKLLIMNHYGGYNSRSNIVMLNPYSVMRCLKTKKIDTYWDIHKTVCSFVSLAASNEGRKTINEYLKRYLPPSFLHFESYIKEDYVRLKRTLLGLGEEHEDRLFSPYFFDHGMLCNTLTTIRKRSISKMACLKLVNEEVYQQVQTVFQSYIIKLMDLPRHLCNEKKYITFADYMNDKTDWLE